MGLELLLGGAVAAGGISDSVQGHFAAKDVAKELRERGNREAARIRSAGRQVRGAQRAGYGASGVTQSGTPQDVANDTISKIHQEVLRQAMPFFDKAIDIKSMATSNLIGGVTGSLLSGVTAYFAAGGTLPSGTPPSALGGGTSPGAPSPLIGAGSGSIGAPKGAITGFFV